MTHSLHPRPPISPCPSIPHDPPHPYAPLYPRDPHVPGGGRGAHCDPPTSPPPQFSLLSGLGSLGLMVWLTATPHSRETEQQRLGMLAGFAFLTGMGYPKKGGGGTVHPQILHTPPPFPSLCAMGGR